MGKIRKVDACANFFSWTSKVLIELVVLSSENWLYLCVSFDI